MSKTAVVAFSGGLDTSCIVSWLKEDYAFDEVVAVLVDVGQTLDVEPSIARGRAAGADDIVLLDKRHAFAEEAVFLQNIGRYSGLTRHTTAAVPMNTLRILRAPRSPSRLQHTTIKTSCAHL